MIRLRLDRPTESPLDVLCLGCHADDIEIGCGGTILNLVEQYPQSRFHWVVFSAVAEREAEARKSAELFAHGGRLLGPLLKKFPDGFMPFAGAEIKSVFEELKRTISPDLIFTHSRRDAHQDHRLIAELTWNTFRNHLILEYEIPKYDGDFGTPNLFAPLSAATLDSKIELVLTSFPSQASKPWFSADLFRAVARIRGMECNAPERLAEAFYCRKLVF